MVIFADMRLVSADKLVIQDGIVHWIEVVLLLLPLSDSE